MAAPIAGSVPPPDHFGPHNAVEWVIWIGAIVVVGFILWRAVVGRLPPE